jgi:ribosome biogenesis GTPase
MTYTGYGRVIKGVGGLFTVRMFDRASRLHNEARDPMPLDGMTVSARGRGVLHKKGALLVGDLVEVSYDDTSFTTENGVVLPSPDGTGIAIDRVCDRTCALIRPPMANLDVLFVTFAAAAPDPILETVDKLISIAEYNHIEPVIVVTKSELAPEYAAKLETLYRNAGFAAFRTGIGMDEGKRALRDYIDHNLDGKIAAFSGASGVGKSTMLNELFPELHLETGEISRRIERGKNTTRHVELYPLSDAADCGFLADTPGFTMLDFERFDFFDKEDLPLTFREFVPYIGSCRYTKCSHTKEQGCAILEAVREGTVAPSRHQSFVSLYEVLKKKSKW